MRVIKCLLSLLVPMLCSVPCAWGLSLSTNAQSQTHCIGRSVFSTDKDIRWHLMDMRWDRSGSSETYGQDSDIELRNMMLKYAYGFTKDSHDMASISVSPKTTFEVFNKLVGIHSPGALASKKRVVQKAIDQLSAVMTRELSETDPARYESLRDERKRLEALLKRILHVRIEIVILESYIALDKAKNISTEKTEAELKAYEAEYATFPTDERYAREMAFDFGMPDAFGAYYHGQLVVLLWRNERIYKFAFGQENRDIPEWNPFFEGHVPAAHELLSRFRTREEFEIPEESGFCIPFGFIADDGRASYSINMTWHPVNKPSYLHNLKLDNSVLGGLDLLLIPTARVMSPGLPLGDLVKAFGPIPIDVGTRKGIMGGFYNRSSDPEVEPPVFTESYSIMGGQAAKGLEPSLVLEVKTSGSQEPLPFDEAQEAFKTILKSFQVLPAFRKAPVSTHP